MKNQLLLFALFILFTSCKSEENKETKTEDKTEVKIEENQKVDYDLKIYNFEELQPLLNKKDGKTYVVNFWATWCAPCVKELPYFEELNANYSSKNVEVLLVSLDFPKQYEKRLKPFIVKNKLTSQVVALDDADTNTWIPKISKDWSGAIPATIIYNKEKSQFYEQSFNYEELKAEVDKYL